MIGVPIKNETYPEAYEWCLNTFDPKTIEGRNWYVDMQLYVDPEFVFKYDNDAVLFMLRWL